MESLQIFTNTNIMTIINYGNMSELSQSTGCGALNQYVTEMSVHYMFACDGESVVHKCAQDHE